MKRILSSDHPAGLDLSGEKVAGLTRLPPPRLTGAVSLDEAISKRRSVRLYSGQELTLEQISQLLWSAQGVTDPRDNLRSAPSAGALYPITVYTALKEGFFRYEPLSHSIQKLQPVDLRPSLSAAAFGQDFIAQAAMTVVIATQYSQLQKHYGNRGVRYADMESGHIAQNIQLQAAALGLGSVPVGAFSEKEIMELLKLEHQQEPVYLIPVGHPHA